MQLEAQSQLTPPRDPLQQQLLPPLLLLPLRLLQPQHSTSSTCTSTSLSMFQFFHSFKQISPHSIAAKPPTSPTFLSPPYSSPCLLLLQSPLYPVYSATLPSYAMYATPLLCSATSAYHQPGQAAKQQQNTSVREFQRSCESLQVPASSSVPCEFLRVPASSCEFQCSLRVPVFQ